MSRTVKSRTLAVSALLTTALLAAAAPVYAQSSHQPALDTQLEYFNLHPKADGMFNLVPLRPLTEVRGQQGLVTLQNGIDVLQGPDGNVTVQVGPDGVVVIDSQRREHGDALVAALKQVAGGRPIRFFFTTNGDDDRGGAAQIVRKSGQAIFGGNMAAQASDLANEAVHMAHENVLARLAGVNGDAAADDTLWPKETYAGDEYDFHLNDEGVQFFHLPAAHTDGDSIVFFRRSDVIVAGDLWDTTAYPKIDTAHGGSIQGVLDGLNKIIELTIPGNKQEGGTLVVPGRGRPGDESEVVEYRDMVTIIRDRIRDMSASGMTLAQVKSARPTFDYDGRYGSTEGQWTTEAFITAIYNGVNSKKQRGKTAQ